MKLSFLGAAGTVTGSKTLLETGKTKVLIDCGLFQGLKALRLLNRETLSVDVTTIDAVILTHAHLDHVGYIPLLVKNGYKGPIYSTAPTCALAEIILLDSGKIQEEEARLANKGGYSKHDPAEPLYTIADAEEAMKQIIAVADETWITPAEGIKFCYHKNGHILGSCWIELVAEEKTIVFSGDLGRKHPILLAPPVPLCDADVLVMESTYGDRDHTTAPSDAELANIVSQALLKKGNLIIPTFAVERAQEIMLILNQLKKKNMIPPSVPIYLDSPMGRNATDVYMKYPAWHSLSKEECLLICDETIRIGDMKETFALIEEKHSKIIIAGSGMLTGGRALEYLKAYVEDEHTTVLFVGFQAEGTRGRAMLRGAERIKIHGKYYNVNATIREITSFSGHADRSELIAWVKSAAKVPRKIILNHGEPKSAEALRIRLEEELNAQVSIPLLGAEITV